jgi:hypothetical protein
VYLATSTTIRLKTYPLPDQVRSAAAGSRNHHVIVVDKYSHPVEPVVHGDGRTLGNDERVEAGRLTQNERLAIFRGNPNTFGPRPLASPDLHRLDDADEDGACDQAAKDNGDGPLVHDDGFDLMGLNLRKWLRNEKSEASGTGNGESSESRRPASRPPSRFQICKFALS